MTNEADTAAPPIVGHGVSRLSAVEIDSFNVETKDDEGFIGDRANKGAFRDILDDWRKKASAAGDDTLGDVKTDDISRKELDEVLAKGNGEAAGIVQGAIEDFAKELSQVIRRFLKLKAWRDTERLVIGGGFKESRVGELAIGRTSVLLKAHDAILAVDIGGTNIRAGIVQLNLKKAKDLSKAEVFESELWRHGDEKTNREGAVERLVEMIEDLIAKGTKAKLTLAPFIGIGCPGIILPDGSIERGAQNLPGNWESNKFNLPAKLREAIPKISKEETHVIMHNDAVVQGLSEVPFMQDVESWGVLTIGTGLGNAHFLNRRDED